MAASSASASTAPSAPAGTTTTLFVIRHGETAWNVDGRLQGQLDIPLNERGREQAAAAAAYLSRLHGPASPAPMHAAYSSDLSRAAETAAIIAAAVGVPVVADARLRETNLGVWQGMIWGDVEAGRGAEMRRWKGDVDFAMPDGECLRDRFHRVAAALHDIVRAHPGERVLVVAHGGILDEMGRLAGAVPFGAPTRLKKLNCAISILHFTRAEGGEAAAAAAWATPAADLLRRDSVDPRTAGAAMGGAWAVAAWGVTEHLTTLAQADGKPLLDGRLEGTGAGAGAGAAPPVELGGAEGLPHAQVMGESAEEAAVSGGGSA
jgi:probable phosphoglycerate mutase